jgi:hypothetical protein
MIDCGSTRPDSFLALFFAWRNFSVLLHAWRRVIIRVREFSIQCFSHNNDRPSGSDSHIVLFCSLGASHFTYAINKTPESVASTAHCNEAVIPVNCPHVTSIRDK